MKRVILVVFAVGLSFGQKPNSSLSFEVASVKPCPPETRQSQLRTQGCFGGPGTPSPGQYVCFDATVAIMVRAAFGLKNYQLPGVSMWSGPSYDVRAPIPAGATKEQVRIMLQNLLIERFKLTYHFEKREMPVYALVVSKNGPKLNISRPEPPPPSDGGPTASTSHAPTTWTMGPYGVPLLPPIPRGATSAGTMANGVKSFSASAATMDRIVEYLSTELGRPVTDATGLTGQFDFTLTFMGEGGSGSGPSAVESDAPTLFTAIQEQLGLKLEQKKGLVYAIFIDHVEKNPTAN